MSAPDPPPERLIADYVAALEAENAHLKAEVERFKLALIEAQNPGIDMDKVRETRPKPKLPDPILREE